MQNCFELLFHQLLLVQVNPLRDLAVFMIL